VRRAAAAAADGDKRQAASPPAIIIMMMMMIMLAVCVRNSVAFKWPICWFVLWWRPMMPRRHQSTNRVERLLLMLADLGRRRISVARGRAAR
jgi:hypothetical protein